MLSVYQVSLPTPYPVGPVNVYLIKNDPLTLVDAGPDTEEARKILRSSLRDLGVDVADIKKVLITHAHPDHFGLASWINEVSSAKVYVHPYELRRMTGESNHIKERLPLIADTGIPSEAMQEITGEQDKLPHPSVDVECILPLNDNDIIKYREGQLQAMLMPGHAPGHVCFYEAEEEHFLSGDFLLPHITPNPILEPDPQNPSRRMPTLNYYLNGLDRLEKMNVKIVWPGHGGVFNNHKEVIKAGREHHERQFAVVKKALDNGKRTCYEISRYIYPTLKGWQVFMGISEIQAHLDYMLETGSLEGEYKDGVIYYGCREGGRTRGACK